MEVNIDLILNIKASTKTMERCKILKGGRNMNAFNKNQGKIIFMVVFALLLQLVGPVVMNSAYADEGEGPKEIASITDVEITYADGTEIGKYIDPNRIIKLNYTWEIPKVDGTNIEVNEGDYTKIIIPDDFNIGESDLTGFLDNYGIWYLNYETRELKLTFNAIVGQESEVSGHVKLELGLNIETVRVDVPYEIIIPISGGTIKKEIKFKPKEGLDITKEGSQNTEDKKRITWKVDINKSLKELANGSVVDILDSRLGYIDGSMEIYELKVYSDGTVEEGDIVTNYNLEYPGNVEQEKTITVTFDPLNINKAYRLVYQTEILEVDISKENATYVNNVKFNEKEAFGSV